MSSGPSVMVSFSASSHLRLSFSVMGRRVRLGGATDGSGRAQICWASTPSGSPGTGLVAVLDWSGIAQVARRTCERVLIKTGKRTLEMSYAITSLAPTTAQAAQLERCGAGTGQLRTASIMSAM